jgi:hypothetical protein
MTEEDPESLLERASEWQEKAEKATSPMLKSALEAVAREYIRMAAEISSRQARDAGS